MWATMNFSYYGIFLWLPLQFVRKGLPLDQALLFSLIIALAQVPGYFAAACLVERWGRAYARALPRSPAPSAPGFSARSPSRPPPFRRSWPGALSFRSSTSAPGASSTPTRPSSTRPLARHGPGWAAAFGRLWAILAPLSVSLQLARFGSAVNVFVAFVAVMLFGAAIVLALGEETRGRSLEEIASA